ncbi:MAG: hypothetical protein E4H15_07985 [Syntrophobacterales bacterium]|nr:MAG: hypothetical protein E4H15_07985 [Syntrophobacterales bacterium]
MNIRHDFSKVSAVLLCVFLFLALGDVPEREPFGLHLDSDEERVSLNDSDVDLHDIQVTESCSVRIRDFFQDGPSISTVAKPLTPSLRRSGSLDAWPVPPYEAGSGSSTVLRI